MKYNFDNNLLNVLGLSNKNRYEIEYIIEIIEKKGWKNLNGDIIVNDDFYLSLIHI